MASIRKVFLKRNASFCKIWSYPPPRPTSLAKNKQQNRHANKEPSNFFCDCVYLVKSGVRQFRLFMTSFGHHWPFCATSSHLDDFPKRNIFLGVAFIRKVFLKKKAVFCKIWPYPPPLVPPAWRWTNKKTATQIKSLPIFSVNAFIWLNLEFVNLGYFGLVLAIIGHSVPLCNFLLCSGHFLTMYPTGSITSKNKRIRSNPHN